MKCRIKKLFLFIFLLGYETTRAKADYRIAYITSTPSGATAQSNLASEQYYDLFTCSVTGEFKSRLTQHDMSIQRLYSPYNEESQYYWSADGTVIFLSKNNKIYAIQSNGGAEPVNSFQTAGIGFYEMAKALLIKICYRVSIYAD